MSRARCREPRSPGATSDAVGVSAADEPRLARYAAGAADPTLEQAMYDYGRYLLLSSSRPGGLPANLQGLWNNSNQPAVGLRLPHQHQHPDELLGRRDHEPPECHEALIDVHRSRWRCRAAWRPATRSAQDTRGWTARTIAEHLRRQRVGVEHRRERLVRPARLRALGVHAGPRLPARRRLSDDQGDLPVLGGPPRRSVPTAPSSRPTAGRPSTGRAKTASCTTSRSSGTCSRTTSTATTHSRSTPTTGPRSPTCRHGSPRTRSASWGQLQEWQNDRDDPNDIHRHTSHLFAVYPGRQITTSDSGVRGGGARLAEGAVRREGRRAVHARRPSPATAAGRGRGPGAPRSSPASAMRNGPGSCCADSSPTTRCRTCSATTRRSRWTATSASPAPSPRCSCRATSRSSTCCPRCPDEWKADGSFAGLRARGGYEVSCHLARRRGHVLRRGGRPGAEPGHRHRASERPRREGEARRSEDRQRDAGDRARELTAPHRMPRAGSSHPARGIRRHTGLTPRS